MKPTSYNQRICMRFAVYLKQEASFNRKYFCPGSSKLNLKPTKRQIKNLIFENCNDCLTMAAIPHGVFAARKVRDNNERRFHISKMEKTSGNERESKRDTGYSKKNAKEEGRELTPLKHNSKLMNSIWGLYNRYSVHNFKKNADADDEIVAAVYWGPEVQRNRPPITSKVECTTAAQVRQFLGIGSARL